MRAHGFATAAFVLALVTGRAAFARDLWVDHDSKGGPCDDARAAANVTKTAPWCKLGTAGSRVQPGDIVHVRGGTYTEAHTCPSCNDNAILQIVVPGTSAQWIVFRAEPNEKVILRGGAAGVAHGVISQLDAAYTEIDGFAIESVSNDCVSFGKNDSGGQPLPVSDIRFRNLDISHCGRSSLELHKTRRALVEGCRVHDSNTSGWTSAIDLYVCLDGNVIRGNYIWNNADQSPGNPDSEGHGITMDVCGAGGGALIENNVIWNNEGWCMAIYKSDGATIRNNTCVTNGLRAGAGEISLYGNNGQLHNNILVSRAGSQALTVRYNDAYAVNPATLQEDANVLWSSTGAGIVSWGGNSPQTFANYKANNGHGWGATSLYADPKLVNAATSDFHLLGDSPAVDSGDNGHAPTGDAEGHLRPFGAKVDRGAYEFGSTAPAPPGTPPGAPPGGATPGDATDAGAGASPGTPAQDPNAASQASGPSSSEGCGCTTTSRSPGWSVFALVLAGLGLAWRRSKR